MLDFCVGLDTEFSEIVEGSHLYYPKTKFEQVIVEILDYSANAVNITLPPISLLQGHSAQGTEAAHFQHSQQFRGVQTLPQEDGIGRCNHVWGWDGDAVPWISRHWQDYDGQCSCEQTKQESV